MKPLRVQIEEIARDTFGARLASVYSFPQQVRELAVAAFENQWEDSTKTRAIRRALLLLRTVGWVRDDEKEVS